MRKFPTMSMYVAGERAMAASISSTDLRSMGKIPPTNRPSSSSHFHPMRVAEGTLIRARARGTLFCRFFSISCSVEGEGLNFSFTLHFTLIKKTFYWQIVLKFLPMQCQSDNNICSFIELQILLKHQPQSSGARSLLPVPAAALAGRFW